MFFTFPVIECLWISCGKVRSGTFSASPVDFRSVRKGCAMILTSGGSRGVLKPVVPLCVPLGVSRLPPEQAHTLRFLLCRVLASSFQLLLPAVWDPRNLRIQHFFLGFYFLNNNYNNSFAMHCHSPSIYCVTLTDIVVICVMFLSPFPFL